MWALVLASLSMSHAMSSDAPPKVTTAQGVLQGQWFQDSPSAVFLGVPFAAAPVGTLRFAAPEAAVPYPGGMLDATEYGAGCIQECHLQHPEVSCPAKYSEDCLFLNVFSPSSSFPTGSLPVLFFIHGGNYIIGAGGVDFYHGSQWAVDQDVIIVTINYRLGLFGGLATPDGVPGNFQFQDQRMALQWVRDNIAAFGGNPNQVTIFGQSAGGFSVAAHLASPKSTGLFHRAIVMSDPYSLPTENTKFSQQLGAQVLDVLGCPDSPLEATLECLRSTSLDSDTLLMAQNNVSFAKLPWILLNSFMPWTPIVDGTDELPLDPLTAAVEGKFNKVPIMVSSVANESVQFIWEAASSPLPKTEYELYVAAIFGPLNALDIFDLYGPPPANQTQDGDVRYFLSTIGTDYIFTCANRWVSRHYAAHTPTYRVIMEHLPSFEHFLQHDWYPECDDYVCHGSDLPLLFNSISFVPDPKPDFTMEEKVLSEQMQTIWANFAKSGNPNVPAALPVQAGQHPATFPAYNASGDAVWKLNVPSAAVMNPRADYCDYFDTIGYTRR